MGQKAIWVYSCILHFFKLFSKILDHSCLKRLNKSEIEKKENKWLQQRHSPNVFDFLKNGLCQSNKKQALVIVLENRIMHSC